MQVYKNHFYMKDDDGIILYNFMSIVKQEN